MKIAKVHLVSISPYSQSRFHETPKLNKEMDDAYRQRTWREHLHYDHAGQVYIDPLALKNCLSEAAQFLGMKIPGQGRAQYTKHFVSGLIVMDPIYLGIHKDDVEPETLFLPSNGQRGGNTRVLKTYPLIKQWQGHATIYISDDLITEEIFRYHLGQGGTFIGLGRFRPSKNGFYGRFRVESMTWEEAAM